MVAGNLVLILTAKIAPIILQGKYCNEFSPGFNHVLILRTNIKIECHLKKYITSSPRVNSGGMVRGEKKEEMNILVMGWAKLACSWTLSEDNS